MYWTQLSVVLVSVSVVRTQVIPGKSRTSDGDYNTVNTDGSFDFGYANKDRGASYHLARATASNVVGGRFGARDPKTDTIKETVYTAGPRGFRAKGPNVHRKMDLDQRPRGPIGNKDDPYFDPNEDPSYAFKADTATYSKNEVADSRGDVKGHYSFIDDIGERHDVSYIAGRDTGFHVSSAHPDNPNVIGSPFHRAPLVRGESRPRGRTAIQRGLDGSYRFISAGPDQRRTESSDANGNVRGSYTFLDDKGVQRTVHYIAGPGIGYRIVKNGKDPYIPPYFPTIPSAYDPDFISAGAPSFAPDDVSSSSDDIFKGPDATAASGHVKPPPFPSSDKERPNKKPGSTGSSSRPSSSEESSGGFDSGSSYGGPGSDRPSYGSGSSSDRPSFGGSSGERPGFGDKPSYGGGKPSYGGGKPSYGGDKPSYGSGGSRPSYGSGSGGSKPIYGSGSSGSKPTLGSGSGGSNFGSGLGGDGSSYGSGPGVDVSYIDEDYGKPSKAPGKPGRPTVKPFRPSKVPFRPTKKPYVPLKPSQTPTTTDYGGTGSYNSDKNTGPDYSNNFDSNKNENKGPEFAVGFNIQHDKPGSTIIRNIGQDFFGVPPGVSVRAHVQSIDLYPFNSKPISPSEALEKEKT